MVPEGPGGANIRALKLYWKTKPTPESLVQTSCSVGLTERKAISFTNYV